MSPAARKLTILFGALSLGAAGTIAAEGWVLKGYPDPVLKEKLPTACGGVTEGVVLGRVYSEDECLRMQAAAMVKHATPILSCVRDDFPADGAPYLRVMMDTAFNIGTAGFLGSSMCRQMKAGDYAGACASILKWDRAGGLDCKVRSNNCYGVVVRRREAYAHCMGALP